MPADVRIYSDYCTWTDKSYVNKLIDAAVTARVGLHLVRGHATLYITAACKSCSCATQRAGWSSEIGADSHQVVWPGWDGGEEWREQAVTYAQAIAADPRAPWVVRSVEIGSEVLLAQQMSNAELIAEMATMRQNLSAYGMAVSTSDQPSFLLVRRAEASLV